MKSEFIGNIQTVREVEDCIRATRKYTKGAFRSPVKHPIQGEEFSSRLMTEYYEVYPNLELNWDMPASDAWAWVWGEVLYIDVRFQYDYRINKGKISIKGGNGAVKELAKGIPLFSEALAKVIADGHINR